MISAYNQYKAKLLKQRIIATLIIFFMFAMIASLFQLQRARAAADQTNVLTNITAGSLSIDSSDSAGFADTTTGTSQNITANFALVSMIDTRGTGANWSVTATMPWFYPDENTVMNNWRLTWDPGTLTGWNGASTAGIDCNETYSTGNFGATRTLCTTSAGGMGTYTVNNTVLNLLILASDKVDNYTSSVTLTIS